jgi:hypothetical protein
VRTEMLRRQAVQAQNTFWLGLGIGLLIVALAIYLPFINSGGAVAVAFWSLVICGNLCFIRWGRFRTSTLFSLTGAAMNAVVIIANGGYMPVVGLDEPTGIWRPADSGSHLLLIADRMAFGGFSPGDFLLMAALLVMAARCATSLHRTLRAAIA